MKTIISPVNVEVLESLLIQTNYDPEESAFLIDGFKNGFDIEYHGPKNRRDTGRNIPFQVGVGSKEDMWEKIMKEVKCKRYAGPYDEIPFKTSYVQSPIGLVPKADNETRLIFYLSYDFKSGNKSINHYTPHELCTVKYSDLDQAMRLSLNLVEQLEGVNNQSSSSSTTIHYSKTDLMSAFRILPLKKKCYQWLILKAYHPRTGKVAYFIEKNLPFGSSISCSHFQRFSNCLKHIFEHIVEDEACTVNYLDDFLFISSSTVACNQLVRQFLLLCQRLNVPVADEKTEWACPVMKFLGMQLDGVNLMMTVPIEKINKALNWLSLMEDKKKATVNQLEKLTGLLNFLGRAIVPGRAFTRRMYAKFSKIIEEKQLRKYHHLSLDWEFKSDCKVWKTFLTMSENNRLQKISQPFIDINEREETAETLFFYSDASANPLLGFGAIFGEFWCYKQWEPNFIAAENPSIEFLELYALCIGVFTWAPLLKNHRFTLYCDNKTVCGMVNQYSSGCKFCMTLVWQLVLKSLKWNFRIFVEHVKGKKNFFSDSLSRLQFRHFHYLIKKHKKSIQHKPTEPTEELWPVSKYWNKYCTPLKNFK